MIYFVIIGINLNILECKFIFYERFLNMNKY